MFMYQEILTDTCWHSTIQGRRNEKEEKTKNKKEYNKPPTKVRIPYTGKNRESKSLYGNAKSERFIHYLLQRGTDVLCLEREMG